MTHEHYSRAPITEALISIQTEVSAQSTIENLNAFATQVSTEYPVRLDLHFAHVVLSTTDTSQVSANQIRDTGLRLESGTTPNRVIQVKPDMFGFSWLPPYTNWEALRSEACATWRTYREAMNPVSVPRMVVKYINRLEFTVAPTDNVRLEDYFNAYPQVPDFDPIHPVETGMGNSFMQVQLPQHDIASWITFTFGISAIGQDHKAVVSFDIDAISAKPSQVDDADVWATVDQLHDREYEAFERFITDRTRDMIR